jgi:hypothetical protein
MYLSEGIISISCKELARKEDKAKELPPGDERAKCMEIIGKVRDMIINVENTLANGQRIRTKMIDEIELWMSRI